MKLQVFVLALICISASKLRINCKKGPIKIDISTVL